MPKINNLTNTYTSSLANTKKTKKNSKKGVITTKKYVEPSNKNSSTENIPLNTRKIKPQKTKNKAIKKNSKQQIKTSTEKNNADKKDLIEGAAGIPPIAEVIRQEQKWAELQEKFYPDLGDTPEEEKTIFLQSLKEVTRGLEGQEKSKAVLLHVLERFKATGFTYGLDIDTEGVRDIASSVAETLADKGQGIDCEDFSIMADFWMKSAIEAGYLPEGSESFIFTSMTWQLDGHAVAMYKSPEGDYYILDGTMGCDRLYTLDQYREVSTYLDVLNGKYEYDPLKLPVGKLTYKGWITEEKLSYSSDSPLDKSISNMGLKRKIYAEHGVAPDPASPAQEIYDYSDSLLQYTHIEFTENKFDYTFTQPMALLPNAGSAVAEGTVATAFALYKRHKLTRRRANITAAYDVQTKLKKNPLKTTDKLMKFYQFKDFSHLSFLIDNNYSNKEIIPLAQTLNSHKSYQTTADFNNLIKNLTTIFPDDKNLESLKDKITEENIADPKQLAKIQKQLKQYDIKIEYQKLGSLKQQIPDKFRKKKNEKLQACMHEIIIDKKIFYKQLKNTSKLPEVKIITAVVNQNNETITTLNKLKNYDDWKLNFIKKDTSMKFGAALAGMIPIIPVDELVRTGAYVMEEKYRIHNKANMQHRVKTSLDMLQQQKQCFTDEDYNKLSSCLNNVEEMKTRHIELKANKVRRMQGIHLTAALVKPATDVAGPIGTGVRSGAKATAKIASSVYPMVRRYQGDKKQKQRQAFNTASDVYNLYKELYLQAKANNNTKQQDAMLRLADESFDLEPYEFETLINTSLIENKQFKLSFSRPIGYQARVPYTQDTKF